MKLQTVALLLTALSACPALADPAGPGQPGSGPVARWIAPSDNAPGAPCPIFRKSFALDERPSSATVRIIGLGHYQLRCNGAVVGDTVINQAWSQYNKTLYRQEFDLAPHLHSGENIIAIALTRGSYARGL